jgi:hypothetical protein
MVDLTAVVKGSAASSQTRSSSSSAETARSPDESRHSRTASSLELSCKCRPAERRSGDWGRVSRPRLGVPAGWVASSDARGRTRVTARTVPGPPAGCRQAFARDHVFSGAPMTTRTRSRSTRQAREACPGGRRCDRVGQPSPPDQRSCEPQGAEIFRFTFWLRLSGEIGR